MKVLLCTGGIGSGKSFVVEILRAMGYPAYDCDARAKALYDEEPELLAGVVTLAGREVLSADGRLDRKALAARLFAEPTLRAKVEALVHPAVIRDFERWKAALPAQMASVVGAAPISQTDAPNAQQGSLAVLESAILLEHPQYRPLYDKVLVVSAPEDIRIARVIARDGASREAVLQRMASQWPEERRRSEADYIIENDGEQPLLPQLTRILSQLQYGKD